MRSSLTETNGTDELRPNARLTTWHPETTYAPTKWPTTGSAKEQQRV